MYKVERRGRRKITTISDDKLESVFCETDNLDKKKIEEAEDNYERAFIVIRESLENNEQICCDDETDRLSVTQVVVDALRRQSLIVRP